MFRCLERVKDEEQEEEEGGEMVVTVIRRLLGKEKMKWREKGKGKERHYGMKRR